MSVQTEIVRPGRSEPGAGLLRRFGTRPAGTPIRVGWLLLRGSVVGLVTTVLSLMIWAVVPLLVGWHGSVVLSGSMRPALAPGDVVLYAPVRPSEIRPGQAIVFRDPAMPGRIDVHRVVRRTNGGGFITRGDANAHPDSTPVPPGNVLGLPRLRVPWVGLPQYWWRRGDVAHLALTTALLAGAGWVAVRDRRRRPLSTPRHRRSSPGGSAARPTSAYR